MSLDWFNKTAKVESSKGYRLLMNIIDRRVFDVEDERVSEREFTVISDWIVGEYQKAVHTTISGRVIKAEPLLIAEVVGKEPVYVEVHDYGVKYRVNLYPETCDITIQVLEEVKAKKLAYRIAPELS